MNKCILTISILSVLGMFVGCNSNSHSESAVLRNLTPNMNGLAETYSENDAGILVVNNANDRMIVDDLRRATLLDRPSSLSPFPVVQD